MRAFIKSLRTALLLGFILFTTLTLFLITSTPGLFLSYQLVRLVLPGHLSIQGLEGRLINHIQFQTLQYHTDSQHIQINNLSLHYVFHPLSKKLSVHSLNVEKLQIQSQESSLPQNAFQLPQLPLILEIQQARIQQLQIASVILKEIQFSALLMQQQWTIEQLKALYQDYQLQAHAQLSPIYPYRLSSTIEFKSLSTAILPVLGTMLIEGDFTHYRLKTHFTQPTVINLDADLYQGKELRLNGQWKDFRWGDWWSDKGDVLLQGAIPNINGRLRAHINTLQEHTLIVKLATFAQGIEVQASLGKNQLQLSGGPQKDWLIQALLEDPQQLDKRLEGLKTKISMNGQLQSLTQGTLQVSMDSGQWQTLQKTQLPFKGGNGEARLDASGLQFHGRFMIDAEKKIGIDCNLPQLNIRSINPATQAIHSKLTLTMNSLAFLNQLSPDFSDIRGQLNAELDMKGTLTKPKIQGKVQLVNGGIKLNALGTDFYPIEFSLTSHGKNWKALGKAQMGSQIIDVSGRGELSPHLQGILLFSGDKLLVINSADYQIRLSPKLSLEILPDHLNLRGDLLIPQALLKPQSFSESVSLSEDVVFEDAKTANRLPIDMDLNVLMGSDVRLSIKGVNGFLDGAIRLRQQLSGPLTASGKLTVREGRYQAYGQTLTIEQGELVFTGGSINNPGINLRAIKQFNNSSANFSGSNQLWDFKADNLQAPDYGNKTTVGIIVSGRLSQPKVQLFSNPASLSQADTLSLLILGKPVNQANQSGAQLLLTAISALNLNNGTSGTQLLSQLKRSLGVDFNLENNAQYDQKSNQIKDNSAFVVGKSLSPRLYLSYNMALSQNDSNALTLKYLLNKFLSVQVNASMNGSGIDLMYTRQKN